MKTPMSPAIFDFAPFLLRHLLDCPKNEKAMKPFREVPGGKRAYPSPFRE